MMYISGAKSEEHRSSISGDAPDPVLHCLSELLKTSSLASPAQHKNVNISKTKKDIPKRKTPFFFNLKSLSNKQQLFFTS